jgi:hypothetical protein
MSDFVAKALTRGLTFENIIVMKYFKPERAITV